MSERMFAGETGERSRRGGLCTGAEVGSDRQAGAPMAQWFSGLVRNWAIPVQFRVRVHAEITLPARFLPTSWP